MRDMSQILDRWGAWARSENCGVDYSPIAAGFKGLLPQNSGNAIRCTDDDGLIIESCLARLRARRPDEHELIVLHYFYKIPKRKLAQRAKRDEKIIRIQVQMAEGFLEGCLSCLDVRLEMEV